MTNSIEVDIDTLSAAKESVAAQAGKATDAMDVDACDATGTTDAKIAKDAKDTTGTEDSKAAQATAKGTEGAKEKKIVKKMFDIDIDTLPEHIIRKIFVFAADPAYHPPNLTPMQAAVRLAQTNKATARLVRPFIWRTVYMTSAEQAQQVHEGLLLSRARPRTTSFVRDLWICTRYISTFSDAAPLLPEHTAIAQELVSSKKLQNLAIDATLLTEGWLMGTRARPTQVMLLNSENLRKKLSFEHKWQLFAKTTHLIVAPHWLRVLRALPLPGSLLPFKALTSLCVCVPATMALEEKKEYVKQLRRLRGLVQLIVCVDNGLHTRVSENNEAWCELKEIERYQANIKVLPYARPMASEWEAIVNGWPTVWERAQDPVEREPLPVTKEVKQGERIPCDVLMATLNGEEHYKNDYAWETRVSCEAPEVDFGAGLKEDLDQLMEDVSDSWAAPWV